MWTFPDRSKFLLSGAEIINFKQNSLKDIPAGSKDYAPDNSWLEQKQIEAILETHHSLVSAQRIEKKSNLSSAVWLSNEGKAKVTKKAGKHWEVFGHTINSEDWLLPEEALFLLETNALELYLEEVTLSVEQTYALIIGDFISLSEYRVYSHLSRKGFRVLRHDKEISVTPYEKDIRADQVSLVAKRSIPGSSSEPKRSETADPSSGELRLVVSEDVSIDKPLSETVVSSADLCKAVSSNEAVSTVGSVSSEDAEDGAALVHSKKGLGKAASASSKYSLGNAASAISNDTPSPEATNDASDIAVSYGSSEAEPTQEDLNSEANSIQKDLEQSTPENALSVHKPSSQIVSLPQDDVPSDSNLEGEAQNFAAECNTSISKVHESISLESDGSVGDDAASDCNVIIEMPDDHMEESSKGHDENPEVSMNIDDSSSEDAFPVSPCDVTIVELKDQVIEIDDDDPASEDGDPEVIILDVRKPHVDTVDLLDSDEDDDVVFISQKPTNWNPSKWRRRFLTATEFVNFKFPEEPTKISKVKLIDLFDMGKKSFDSIWKAIPRHDTNEEFINAPDQRFIPSTILPKYAQYRISLHQRDVSPHSERTPTNVDTSRDLNEIVQYGREPSYFSRNEGYSFRRSRNYNQHAPRFNVNATRPPRNQMFGQNPQNFRYNNFYQGNSYRNLPQGNDQNQQQSGNSNQNWNYKTIWNRFGNQNQHRGLGTFDNNPGVQHSPNPQPQGNFTPNQFGNFNNHPGGVHNEGLKMAVMQAYQMQIMAMGLMHSCQALMQQVPGLVNNPMTNNMFPMNSLLGSNLIGNFNQPPHQYNRGHRPYRRPWRGGQGRRRYYNDDRPPARVTEIPITPNRENREEEKSNVVLIGSDDEDKKVKPKIKRNMALNAIASLNKPKRAKLKITTDVKSIKLDVIDLDEVSSVKSESPCASPRLQDVSKRTRKRVAAASPIVRDATPAGPASTGRVAESKSGKSKGSVSVQPRESVPVHPEENSEDRSIVIISDDSRPSCMVYDEQVSIDSDSVEFASEKSSDAAPERRSEPMEVSESADLTSETLEETDSRPTPPENAEGFPGSWKTYKQQEQSLGEEIQPKTSGPLVSIDNERADIKDVMKSLQVVGPVDDTNAPRNELKVSYDVYLPNQPFKKSVRLLPKYRVIIAKSECFPTVFELNYLESVYRDNVPFLFAVVTSDAIRLFNLRTVSLPTLVPDV